MSSVVSLTRCASYEDEALDRSVGRALDLLDGWERIFDGDPVVLIKPNFLVPRGVRTAITTHPQFIAAVVRAIRRVFGGRLLLGDGPALGTTRAVARRLGLGPLIDPYDVELVNFSETVPVAGGAGFGPMDLARPIVEADRIINLPKVKTHGQMGLTLGRKNLFGAVVGLAKPRLHLHAGREYATFARMLNEIARRAGTDLTIADGVLAIEGNGPSAGDPRLLGLVAASTDVVALDRVFAEVLGFPVEALPMMMDSRGAGEAGAFLSNVEVRGESIDSARVDRWKPARQMEAHDIFIPKPIAGPLRHQISTRPLFDDPLCTRCGICADHCAAGALLLRARGRRDPGPNHSDEAMALDLDECIRCYCCQEVCPEGAIRVGEGALLRLSRLVQLNRFSRLRR